MIGLTRKRKYDPVPTQYLAYRALIGLCMQTVYCTSTVRAQYNPNPDIRHFKAETCYSSYCAMENIYINLRFLWLIACYERV